MHLCNSHQGISAKELLGLSNLQFWVDFLFQLAIRLDLMMAQLCELEAKSASLKRGLVLIEQRQSDLDIELGE